ncbi:hypothetical protein HG717_32305 [Rhodococcus erythropolis]|uniref:hypothetical protein n=1 Tax=Rhodococcus erythropolis TaxID=1833 RepID=UPI001C9A7CE0|nr:hypothetical protein [Rhodococcus erythropolis]MBY6388567.1 hypothetical protein [Rhodococcus erythropolis]
MSIRTGRSTEKTTGGLAGDAGPFLDIAGLGASTRGAGRSAAVECAQLAPVGEVRAVNGEPARGACVRSVRLTATAALRRSDQHPAAAQRRSAVGTVTGLRFRPATAGSPKVHKR